MEHAATLTSMAILAAAAAGATYAILHSGRGTAESGNRRFSMWDAVAVPFFVARTAAGARNERAGGGCLGR